MLGSFNNNQQEMSGKMTIKSVAEAEACLHKAEEALEKAKAFTKTDDFNKLPAEEKAQKWADIAKMEKDLAECKNRLDEVKEKAPTYDEFCKENEDEEGEKSESISLDNTRYIGVEIRKTITGKYEVIFGRSVLCKCDHHIKARAVANAMTRGAVHFAMERKIDAVISGGFSIDKIMKVMDEF